MTKTNTPVVINNNN